MLDWNAHKVVCLALAGSVQLHPFDERMMLTYELKLRILRWWDIHRVILVRVSFSS